MTTKTDEWLATERSLGGSSLPRLQYALRAQGGAAGSALAHALGEDYAAFEAAEADEGSQESTPVQPTE